MSAALLILLGSVIGIGFVGSVIFERTRIPDVLFLILVGMLIGPILNVVTPDSVRPFMSAFGAIALTIILFEGGLDLELRSTFRQAGRALVLAVFSFVATMFLVYYALVLGLNETGRTVWAISAALACTSAPIVIPILAQLFPGSPMRPLLAVESAFSDALAVVTVLILTGPEPQSGSFSLVGDLGHSFLIGGGIALVSGLFWLWLLSHLYARRFFYLMTVGFVFLLMGVVESFHGSGAFAVLLFGLILANGETILQVFPNRFRGRLRAFFANGSAALHPKITESHAEISFLIRSFFFVYLGILFRWPGSDLRMWLAILLVAFAILVAREIAVQLSGWVTGIPAAQRPVLAAMAPRGLATAVLSALIVAEAGDGAGSWETLAVFIVLISNFVMSARLMKIKKGQADDRVV